MSRIYVLGAGRVGSAIARDLAEDHQVTSVDQDIETLSRLKHANRSINIIHTDLKLTNFAELIADADLVISAVPGFLGFKTLKKIIETGKNVVDISFFPEDPFDLETLAKDKKVTAVVDCGVAPGMGNMILGRYNQVMKIDRYECLVGGLPEKREWPWQYKAVFSPIDVIEEYIRPARYVLGGRVVTREALSDPEMVDFEEIGTLESFNTDGLRTLIRTMDIPDMIEKTLRYPGTIEYLRVLRKGGFFSDDPVDINGEKIRPIDLTAKLLFPQWKLLEGERDLTVMRIIMSGISEEGNLQTIHYQLLDRYDESNQVLSMARTTGYTCSAVARLILGGQLQRNGILPPEWVGEDEINFDFVINYLKERRVIYNKIIV